MGMKNAAQNDTNTQNIIQLNDKMKLAQVQPGVRVGGSPTLPHSPIFSLRPWACLCHIKKQDRFRSVS